METGENNKKKKRWKKKKAPGGSPPEEDGEPKDPKVKKKKRKRRRPRHLKQFKEEGRLGGEAEKGEDGTSKKQRSWPIRVEKDAGQGLKDPGTSRQT